MKKIPKKEVYFEATYNPHKKVVSVDGEGSAEITFTTDATQLAPVLLSLAKMKDSLIGIRLEKLGEKNSKSKIEKTRPAKYR